MVIHALLAAALTLTPAAAPQAPQAAQARVDCARVKCLALTFDDGPGEHTPELLKVLRKANAKATFFLVGKQVERRPKIARQTLAQGHAIGDHTYSHTSLPRLLDEEISEEIRLGKEVIEKATGHRPTMFRPPYGHTDERVLRAAEEADLAQVLWTGTTLDWSLRDADKITAKVLKLARRNGVILMHDTVPATVKAMPGILKELRKQGYHLVTVPTLLRGTGRALEPGVSYP
ncbi:polysaccharide deacetylase family protein [Actinomadura sp. ATCC 31491]|uniref:Polysaccharide deacetylase family protein n=1 Tax=Actinomadura luzonensis TaxID=2805427 RepID=A0ABT0FSD8_9ACTN|nr:polysaccharide deacetylase family protein [Actinomadura luzonensis]MCK2215189.1 polysaccharide deacetylase family protein [Actinomadura luzonensis]